MTNAEFARYYPRYLSAIEAIARKYAGTETDLFEDLKQEGIIGLYEADLRRPFKNEDAFLRAVVRNKIVDHIRWLDPARFDRLDQHLALGGQPVKDPDSGQLSMVRTLDARTERTRRATSWNMANQATEEDDDG